MRHSVTLTSHACIRRPLGLTPARSRSVSQVAHAHRRNEQPQPQLSVPSHILAGLASLAVVAAPFQPALAAPAETPYTLQSSMQYGVTPRGTPRQCPGNVNPNCVSTASTNSNYGPAWRATQADVSEATRVLEAAVLDGLRNEGAQSLQSQSLPIGEYRMFGFETDWGPNLDTAEFLIKPGASGEGALVTYRAMAGNVKYIWPIQQAVMDFGAQRDRLDRIRAAAGWQIIGCDVIECYDFSD